MDNFITYFPSISSILVPMYQEDFHLLHLISVIFHQFATTTHGRWTKSTIFSFAWLEKTWPMQMTFPEISVWGLRTEDTDSLTCSIIHLYMSVVYTSGWERRGPCTVVPFALKMAHWCLSDYNPEYQNHGKKLKMSHWQKSLLNHWYTIYKHIYSTLYVGIDGVGLSPSCPLNYCTSSCPPMSPSSLLRALQPPPFQFISPLPLPHLLPLLPTLISPSASLPLTLILSTPSYNIITCTNIYSTSSYISNCSNCANRSMQSPHYINLHPEFSSPSSKQPTKY